MDKFGDVEVKIEEPDISTDTNKSYVAFIEGNVQRVMPEVEVYKEEQIEIDIMCNYDYKDKQQNETPSIDLQGSQENAENYSNDVNVELQHIFPANNLDGVIAMQRCLQVSCTAQKEKVYTCYSCDFHTRHLKHFQVHKREQRHIEKINKLTARKIKRCITSTACNFCLLKTSRKQLFQIHKNNSHVKEKNFPCSYCNAKYETPTVMHTDIDVVPSNKPPSDNDRSCCRDLHPSENDGNRCRTLRRNYFSESHRYVDINVDISNKSVNNDLTNTSLNDIIVETSKLINHEVNEGSTSLKQLPKLVSVKSKTKLPITLPKEKLFVNNQFSSVKTNLHNVLPNDSSTLSNGLFKTNTNDDVNNGDIAQKHGDLQNKHLKFNFPSNSVVKTDVQNVLLTKNIRQKKTLHNINLSLSKNLIKAISTTHVETPKISYSLQNQTPNLNNERFKITTMARTDLVGTSSDDKVFKIITPVSALNIPSIKGSTLVKNASSIRSTTNQNNIYAASSERKVPKTSNLNDIKVSTLISKNVEFNNSFNPVQYKCFVCSIKFPIQSILESHMKMSHGIVPKNRINCSVCTYQCTIQQDMEIHMKTHKKFKCPLCTYSCYKPSILTSHLSSEHKGIDKPYPCYICGENFAYEKALKQHKDEHNRILHKQCTVCDYICSTFISLSQHMNKEHPYINKPYFCLTCGVRFRYKIHLIKHAAHHKITTNQQCPLCPYKCLGYALLSQHTVQKHPGVVQPYICYICGERFTHENLLEIHIDKHKIITNRQCPLCSSKYSDDILLSHHITKAHPGIKKPYVCSKCGEKYISESSLKVHTKRHNNMVSYQCPLCSFNSTSHKLWKKHFLKDHPEASVMTKLYACPKCGEKFQNQTVLKRHVRLKHEVTTVYRCSVCNFTCASQISLDYHLKEKHGDVDVYLCSESSKTFKYKSSFKVHKRSHSLTLKLECLLCTYRCYHQGFMKHHFIKEHVRVYPDGLNSINPPVDNGKVECSKFNGINSINPPADNRKVECSKFNCINSINPPADNRKVDCSKFNDALNEYESYSFVSTQLPAKTCNIEKVTRTEFSKELKSTPHVKEALVAKKRKQMDFKLDMKQMDFKLDIVNKPKKNSYIIEKPNIKDLSKDLEKNDIKSVFFNKDFKLDIIKKPKKFNCVKEPINKDLSREKLTILVLEKNDVKSVFFNKDFKLDIIKKQRKVHCVKEPIIKDLSREK